MYLAGVADPKVTTEIKNRISRLDVASILESGYIEEYIEDAPFSPFATIGYSEKPDVIAGRVLEGRVAIVVDGTPFCTDGAYAVCRKLSNRRRLLFTANICQPHEDSALFFHILLLYSRPQSILLSPPFIKK